MRTNYPSMFHGAVKIFSAMYPSETVRRVPEPSQPSIIRGSGVSEGNMAENIAPGKDQERKTRRVKTESQLISESCGFSEINSAAGLPVGYRRLEARRHLKPLQPLIQVSK